MDTNNIYGNNVGDSPSYINSAIEVDSTPRYYEEIPNVPVESSQGGAYEEISDTVTDRPSVQDGSAYEPLRHETSNRPDLNYNVYSQDSVGAAVAPNNTTSVYENVHWRALIWDYHTVKRLDFLNILLSKGTDNTY